ncbi:MAG: low specificity L-threonine aldolase [Candidatus Eisenbacteria bacterium]|uniref:Low specificity L-threonine aldolase n=1 Tax=Eiseniibacteriota bacterium TaxID=2212470 RepID=A0A956M0X3_UNCEI|nr:low specificity L-threonine aldolase [Candidatus Eisenbacteria bacterium]
MKPAEPAIDLRSDTVTLPTVPMREAMARTPVGDDQFGEDPTINRLQERVAEILGKERALWIPTGTMANQIALRTLTRPGDDVVVCAGSHTVHHETGASAANAGVQLTEIGADGIFSAEQFVAACKPAGHIVAPPTTLVEIENTHNRAGGVVVPQDRVERICRAARDRGVASYLDGARLWNASAATGHSPAALSAPFDLVSVAFSKGLGAPGGSMLAGSRTILERAQRYRRMAGGAMRQVGFFAAAALYALDHHLDRLAEDHANCRLLAERLALCPRVRIDLDRVRTNILIFHLTPDGPTAAEVVDAARDQGVLVFAFGPRTVRAVTHLDVSREDCEAAADRLTRAIEA